MKFFTVFALIAMLMAAEARLPKQLQKKWGFVDTVESNQGVERIVKGEKAAKGEAPYVTSIQKRTLILLKSHTCGGSFINKRTIVTAAHCTEDEQPNKISSRFGTNNRLIPGKQGDRNTERFVNHENYNNDTVENDIALIIVDKDVSPSENVAFVEYDTTKVNGNEDVAIFGWGLTAGSNYLSPVDLMKGNLKTLTNEECNTKWGGDNAINSGMLCTFDRNGAVGATTACNGDSGGPLVQNRDGKTFLVGLVSWGESGCNGELPTVYTRVSEYVDWINTHKQN